MTPAPYPMPHNLVSAHWCDPGYLRAIHSFNHSSPKAVFEVERTGWGNAEHLAFYASGYFRRKATGCAGKYVWHNGDLLLQWFSYPHEQLARFGPSLLGSETALEPADLSSRSWMEKEAAAAGKRLVHLGCGENRLEGWFNADLPHFDITRPLPWDDETVDGLFLEHVIEHVSPVQACGFFREARRILKPGGTLRLAFPDVVRIAERATPEYLAFLQRKGWGDGSPGSAVTNIVENHGHTAVWSLPTLTVVLEAFGFEVKPAALGTSKRDDFIDLERHDSHHQMNDPNSPQYSASSSQPSGPVYLTEPCNVMKDSLPAQAFFPFPSAGSFQRYRRRLVGWHLLLFNWDISVIMDLWDTVEVLRDIHGRLVRSSPSAGRFHFKIQRCRPRYRHDPVSNIP